MSFCPVIGFRKIKRCQPDLKLERLGLIHPFIYIQPVHTCMECDLAAAVMDGWDLLCGHFGSPKSESSNLKDGYSIRLDSCSPS